jgi:hypothetical protein
MGLCFWGRWEVVGGDGVAGGGAEDVGEGGKKWGWRG